MAELLPRLQHLAALARSYDIGLNIDAEESERLELSLDLLQALCLDPALAGWNGIGFVVQVYGKRASAVLDWAIDLARRTGHRLMIRLVKGAYWDSEIKRAQQEGLEGFPVFTRKLHTDLSYLACAPKLLAARDAVFPQFATHNAYTVAAVHAMAGPESRRATPVSELVADPATAIAAEESPGAPHPGICLPRDLYAPYRDNAAGLDLSNEDRLRALAPVLAAPSHPSGESGREVRNPADCTDLVGTVQDATPDQVDAALARAVQAAPGWASVPPTDRAVAAVLPGPVGEENRYETRPRGSILCLADSDAALQNQVRTALAAGNRVLLRKGSRARLGPLPAEQSDQIEEAANVNEAAVNAVLFEGEPAALLALGQALAERDGPIIPVFTARPDGAYPAEFLVLERSISTNTTADGGNANLMMIG